VERIVGFHVNLETVETVMRTEMESYVVGTVQREVEGVEIETEIVETEIKISALEIEIEIRIRTGLQAEIENEIETVGKGIGIEAEENVIRETKIEIARQEEVMN
jgi:hypothetical protein